MKKLFGMLIGIAALCIPVLASAEPLKVTMAAGPVAGTSYVAMGAYNKLLTKFYPGSNISLMPGTEISNPLRLENNEIELAAITNSQCMVAKKGEFPFKRPVKGINALANLRTEALLNIAVRADSGITSFEQIRDEKIPVRMGPGVNGSGTRIMFEWVLKEYGITFDDIRDWGGKVLNNDFGDVSELAKDGQVDMIVWLGPGEAWFLTELSANTPLRWLEISQEVADSLKEKYMLYTGYFEGSMYKGMMGKKTRTVGSSVSLFVRENMSEDDVYKLTKVLCEGREDIFIACPQWATFKPETAWSDLPYPVHPGAIKYYKEIGAMK